MMKLKFYDSYLDKENGDYYLYHVIGLMILHVVCDFVYVFFKDNV